MKPQKIDRTAKKETLNNALIKCVNGCQGWKQHFLKNMILLTDTDIYNLADTALHIGREITCKVHG